MGSEGDWYCQIVVWVLHECNDQITHHQLQMHSMVVDMKLLNEGCQSHWPCRVDHPASSLLT